jgi:hypothetical protein
MTTTTHHASKSFVDFVDVHVVFGYPDEVEDFWDCEGGTDSHDPGFEGCYY